MSTAGVVVFNCVEQPALYQLIEQRLGDFQATCDRKIAELVAFLAENLNDVLQHLAEELQHGKDAEDTAARNQPLATLQSTVDEEEEEEQLIQYAGEEPIYADDEMDLARNDGSNNGCFDFERTLKSDIGDECELIDEFQRNNIAPHIDDVDKSTLSLPQPLAPHAAAATAASAAAAATKTFECDLCQRRFCVKESLRVHMRTHTGERPYMCHLCCRRFKQHAPFNRHMRSHCEQREHRCTRCERAFCEKSALAVHMQSHTGERPHACPVCGRGYSKRYHVRKHLRKLHGVVDVDAVFPPKVREWKARSVGQGDVIS